MRPRIPVIHVTSTNIVGSLPNFKWYINISSAPNDTIAQTIAQIPNADSDARQGALVGRARYIHDMNIIIPAKRKEQVVMVVDEDDANRDIKIRNICARNNYKCIGKVMFKKEKNMSEDRLGSSIVKRYANHHHKRSILRLLDADAFNVGTMPNLSYATIVRTTDDHAGSIAGLTVALNKRKISFNIVTVHVEYKEGWITSKKRINNMRITQSRKVTDVNPESDKMWQFKVGYDMYYPTDRGPCELTMGQSKEKETGGTGLTKMIDKIIGWLDEVGGWVIRKLFVRQRKKGKHKKHGLAWTPIIKTAANMTSTTCLTYSVNVENNASKQINKANKLISLMQVNKMMSKVGPTGDKTKLNEAKDPVFDAYIAATMSYNVNDAIVHANNLAAKQNRKSRLTSMYVSTVVTMAYMALSGLTLIAIVIACLALMLTLNNRVDPEALILLNMVLTSGNVGGLMINLAITLIELIINPPSSTKNVRTTIYVIVWLLSRI